MAWIWILVGKTGGRGGRPAYLGHGCRRPPSRRRGILTHLCVVIVIRRSSSFAATYAPPPPFVLPIFQQFDHTALTLRLSFPSFLHSPRPYTSPIYALKLLADRSHLPGLVFVARDAHCGNRYSPARHLGPARRAPARPRCFSLSSHRCLCIQSPLSCLWTITDPSRN